jgi:hypothetical protein
MKHNFIEDESVAPLDALPVSVELLQRRENLKPVNLESDAPLMSPNAGGNEHLWRFSRPAVLPGFSRTEPVCSPVLIGQCGR